MVEKHKMIADFEQLIYSSERLRNAWDNHVELFKELISDGWSNNHVLELIDYIRTTNYADQLFPGCSFGRLLISKPLNGRLNYQQTLTISVDRNNGKIRLEFSDWDTIDSHTDWQKAIIWTANCSGDELKDKFVEFMNWNNNWH